MFKLIAFLKTKYSKDTQQMQLVVLKYFYIAEVCISFALDYPCFACDNYQNNYTAFSPFYNAAIIKLTLIVC